MPNRTLRQQFYLVHDVEEDETGLEKRKLSLYPDRIGAMEYSKLTRGSSRKI